MSRADILVVVDGGGTGTRLRALGPGGAPIGAATGGPASLTLGVPRAWQNIGAALERAFGGPVPRGLRLWCGLAGGRNPERQAAFRAQDPFGCADIAVVTDGFAALMGAHGGRPGAILAVGTGVTAYALTGAGEVRSVSGWGFAIGDEGGGAWIGRRALAQLARQIDGRDPPGPALGAALRADVGADFDAIQGWLASADATAFAGLAPHVVAAARDGDGQAEAILRDAAAELDIALAALPSEGPLAVLGGLGPVFAPRLAPGHRRRLVAPKGGALDGLALMAARGWRTEAAPPAPEGWP